MRVALALFFIAASARAGDCLKELQVGTQMAIAFGDCSVPDAKVATLTLRGESREFPIKTKSDVLHLIVLDGAPPQGLVTQSKVLISIGHMTESVAVTAGASRTDRTYGVAIGPVSEEEKNAMRFRGNFRFERRPNALRGITTRAEVNVDTTDHGDEFIDDNFVGVSGGYGGLRSGDVLRRGFAGARIRYAKPFHTGDDAADAFITFSGNVPLVQAITLGGGPFAAPPLSFDLNYGYRNANSSRGAVFEGTLTHHLFLGGRYWLAASGTFTFDDHTRRLYRVAISQFEDKQSRVTLVTTFEDGSARAVLRKVRQYFIGLGWSFGFVPDP